MSLSGPTVTFPIVGAFFRQQAGVPAPAILRSLPIGTALILHAEPTNAFDANAIAVYIATDTLGADQRIRDALEENLSTSGHTVSELLEKDFLHLGYIPKDIAAVLKARGFPNEGDVEAEFSCAASGAPRVRMAEL